MDDGNASTPLVESRAEATSGVDGVHWAKKGSAPMAAFPDMNTWRDSPGGGLLWMCVLNLITGAAIFVLFARVKSLVSIGLMFVIFMTLMVAGFVVLYSTMQRRAKLASEELGPRLSDRSDPTCRVRCYGTATRMLAIRRHFDAGRSSGFDPVVRFARLALLKLSTVSLILAGGTILSVVVVVLTIVVWKVKAGQFLVQIAGWGTALIYAVLAAAIYPAYYRVSPGRLEVFRAGFLGLGLRVTETYDLSSLYLTVDVGMRIVYFTRPFKVEPPCHQPIGWVSYQAIRDPEDFVATVLQAALCSVAAPELPEDRLA